MIDRFEKYLSVQRSALNARTYRQELLASNIANADTPHFKARDIDFKSALQGALAGSSSGINMKLTSPRHLEGQKEPQYGGALRYRTEYQSAVDGNTVDMDIERSAFVENSTHMSASLTFIKDMLKEMATAIQP